VKHDRCGFTNEDVIRLWASASNLEEFHQVKELAVDVTADLFQVSSTDEKPMMQLPTVTGASTTWTLLSSTRISLALIHSRLTCSSDIGVHWTSCSIWLGESEYERKVSILTYLSRSLGIKKGRWTFPRLHLSHTIIK